MTSPSRSGSDPEAQRWKPPVAFLAMDIAGVALLAFGLILQFEPEASRALSLPASARVPLLVVGGAMMAVGWIGLVRSLLAYRRR